MALTIKGVALNVGTSITLPSHSPGDLIVLWAYNKSSNLTIAIPSSGGSVPAWNNIDSTVGGGNACRSVQVVATSSSHTSGTWASTSLIAVVLSGQLTSGPVGGHAGTTATSSTAAVAPAVTMSVTDGSSVLLHFHGFAGLTSWGSTPSGYTQQGTPTTECLLNTKNVTTSDGSVSQPLTGSFAWSACSSVEILAAPVVANSAFFALF